MVILDEILKFFDAAVWSLRDIIREAEKVTNSSIFDANSVADFGHLEPVGNIATRTELFITP